MEVSCLLSLDRTNPRFPLLTRVAKTGLILEQMNVESERRLAVNARVLTKDRTLLVEKSIIGLRAVKDAVPFYDPKKQRPERIPMTVVLLKDVQRSHMRYRKRLDEEKAEIEKQKAEKQREAEEIERRKKEQQKLQRKSDTMKEDGKALTARRKMQ